MQTTQDPAIGAFLVQHIVFAVTTLASAFVLGCASGRLWFDRSIAAQKLLAETHELATKQALEELAKYKTVNANTSAEDNARLDALKEEWSRRRVGRFFSAVTLSAILGLGAYAVYVQTSVVDAIKAHASHEEVFEQETQNMLNALREQNVARSGPSSPRPISKKNAHPVKSGEPQ